MSDTTLLLNAVEQGDPKAAEKLLDLLYEELRRLAASKIAQEAPGQTLQPTALVHEAWLRLTGTSNQTFAVSGFGSGYASMITLSACVLAALPKVS